MNKYLSLLFVAIVFCSGCDKYDDSAVRSDIEGLESRVTALEQQCRLMNGNISALQALVSAVQGRDCVVSVSDLSDGTGYSITFASGRTVTLRNGKDGKDGTDGKDGADGKDGNDGKDGTDGKDGHTPTVSVRLDSDGVYYWTIDGEWLLDGSGKKIRAQGADGKDGENGKDGSNGTDGTNGVTPQLKIEDGWWFVSYDEGKNWTKLYKATGEDGDSFFSSVTDNGETVTVKLKDGTTFDIPKAKGELGIRFSESEDIGVSAGETKVVEYTIVNGSTETLVKVFGQNGWSAKVQKTDASKGTIIVTAPSPMVEGEVVVLVYEGDSKTVVRFLNFVKGAISAPKEAYSFSGKEGTYEVNLDTNVDYDVNIPAEASSWLSYDGLQTKAMRQDRLGFHVAQNFGPDPRAAVVTITDKAKENTVKISITQKVWDAIDIPDANFKAALVAKFDKDGDGEISREEADAVEAISVMNKGIKSVDGIQNFKNLCHLDCSFNELSSIDLSHNPNLDLLSIAHNSFSSIDLSAVSLDTFICFGNNLRTIDLSVQTKLRSISCGSNPLVTLDLSNCYKNIHSIDALGCKNLTEIYIRKDQAIKYKEIPSNTIIKYLTPDGTVSLLQRHTVGHGIKFIIMGDGFLRGSLAAESGAKSKFDIWADHAMEAIFAEEPYKTFRNRFDVYSVAVESTSETFNGGTALGCTFGSLTYVYGDDEKVFGYARKVQAIDLTQSVVIVILNSTRYAGTCRYWMDGKAIAYVPTTDNDAEEFSRIMLHEAGGHGFAKLSDEYSYSGTGTITSNKVSSHIWWYDAIEAGANVDVTNDGSKIHWSHFLSDYRYSGQIGIYEGALMYQYGVYRPTENSLMRNHHYGGFNAPSREAIYKRIMRLSEGDTWEYDYETFVAYDAVNRSNTSQTHRREELRDFDERTFIPLAPPVFVDGPAPAAKQ